MTNAMPSYSMCRCGKDSGPTNGGDFICAKCQLAAAKATILELQRDLARLGETSLTCARENTASAFRLRESEARYKGALVDARSTRDAAVEQLAVQDALVAAMRADVANMQNAVVAAEVRHAGEVSSLRAQLADAVENRDVALERLEVQRKHYESRIRTLLIERNGAIAELEEQQEEEDTPGSDLAAALASGLAPQGPGQSAFEAIAILSDVLNAIVKHPHVAQFVKPPAGDVYDHHATVTPSESEWIASEPRNRK